MLLFIVRMMYLVVCAGAIASYISVSPHQVHIIERYKFASFLILLGMTQFAPIADLLIRRKRIDIISAVYFGLLVGALLSYLTLLALGPVIEDPFRPGVTLLTTLFLTYICISFLIQTKDDFRFIIPYVEFARDLKGGMPLVLDSSALIDGRVADLVETHIVDTDLVVPEFVLLEIQDIADSNDKNRRSRGRRGLDVLSKLQENPNVDVRITEDREKPQNMTVDERLVHLAKDLNARIVTNDYNLNKVASVQSIHVINMNDVANSLKPRFVPDDHLRIKIVKRGEAADQGVGYLDDGTMVVCENGAEQVGQEIDTLVTKVHQTSAGRIIFVKPSI
ncbi:MAG: PIN/TRAM domain-containing protein [Planctomycetaceae bacterium]|nr:PIN/TRAM domain-containing protein [Planctomycetaceae bacterium]